MHCLLSYKPLLGYTTCSQRIVGPKQALQKLSLSRFLINPRGRDRSCLSNSIVYLPLLYPHLSQVIVVLNITTQIPVVGTPLLSKHLKFFQIIHSPFIVP